MGYYIDFYFQPGTIRSHKDVIEKFCRAGAVRLEPDKTNPKWRNFVDMVYAKHGGKIIKDNRRLVIFKKNDENDCLLNITVWRNPSSQSYVDNKIWTAAGNKVWADSRFSWECDPAYLLKELEEYCDLAKKVDCGIYDGQLDIWITRENLNRIAEGIDKSARSVINVIGTVDEKTYISLKRNKFEKM